VNEPIFVIPPDLIIGPKADVLPLAGEVNWGMDIFGVAAMRSLTNGEGVTTGIVDTGVDRAHPLLTNCVGAKDFTGSRSGAADKHGHGTHCTGTVGATDPRIGVAPGCKTLHGKGLSDSGSGGGSGIAAAVRWCASEGAEIVSMSLGSSGPDSTILAAIKEVAENGVWVIAAGGNSGGGTPEIDWPGRSPDCISVAALNRDLSPASFSSAGEKIDTSGPGVNIWSLAPGGGYRQMSGTSMATPFVAGLLTLYRAALKSRGLPIPDVYKLRELLFARSTDTHSEGDDRRTGPGWVTPLLLALSLVPDPPPVG
jgi:subtilisin